MSTEQILSEYPWLKCIFIGEDNREHDAEILVKRASLDLFFPEQDDSTTREVRQDCFAQERDHYSISYYLYTADGHSIEDFHHPRDVVGFILKLDPEERMDVTYLVEDTTVFIPSGDQLNFANGCTRVLYKPPKGYKSIGEYVWKRRKQLRSI